MATLNILKNPLSIRDREIVLLQDGTTAIDYLLEHYPTGFGSGVRFFVNGEEYDVGELDMELKTTDIAVVLVQPQWEAFVTALVTAFISTAISLVINLLFAEKPEQPEFADVKDPTEVYNINSSQNSARIGQYIPVVYGQVRFFPDLCSQPYKFFELSSDLASPEVNIPASVSGYTRDRDFLINEYGLSGLANLAGTQSTVDIPIVEDGFVIAQFKRYTLVWVPPEHEGGGGYYTTKDYIINRNEFRYQNGQKFVDPTYYANGPSVDGATEIFQYGGGFNQPSGKWSVSVQALKKNAVAADLTQNAQFIDQFLCLGKGDVDVEEIFVGDTPIKNLQPGTFEYHLIKPEQHEGTFGSLTGLFTIGGGREFYENMVTSSAVNGQRFDDALLVGWFSLSETGKTGQFVEFDIEFPTGLHGLDQQTGALTNATIEFELHIQELDSNFNPVGAVITQNHVLTRATNEPIRISYLVDGGKYANWQVAVERISGRSSTTVTNDFGWSGVKMYSALDSVDNLYNETTILAIRLQATESISASSSTRISVIAKRKLKLPGWIESDFTSNPAWIAADVYLNTDYGGRRPEYEIDWTSFEATAAAWEGYSGFNGVFTGRSTIFESMKSVLQVNLGKPLPMGSQIVLIHDGVNPLRSQMYSEENMVNDSLSINYSFDEEAEYDGVEIEYLDPVTFDSLFFRYPELCAFPEEIKLFGCTNDEQAQQYAIIYWNRKLYQRIFAIFSTELEGHIPMVGDRIAVQHSLPRWGTTGFVKFVNGNELTLDRDLDWSLTDPILMLRRDDGSVTEPISISRGGEDDVAILDSAADFTINSYEKQMRTIWSYGSMESKIRDFVITSITPQGGLVVKIDSIIYDERVYVNGAQFMETSF